MNAPSVLVKGDRAACSSIHLVGSPRLYVRPHQKGSLQLPAMLRTEAGQHLCFTILHATLLHWNILVAVGVLGSLGDELDPVLHLSHPGIHAMAGTLFSKAHHTDLGQSKKYTTSIVSVSIICISPPIL